MIEVMICVLPTHWYLFLVWFYVLVALGQCRYNFLIFLDFGFLKYIWTGLLWLPCLIFDKESPLRHFP